MDYKKMVEASIAKANFKKEQKLRVWSADAVYGAWNVEDTSGEKPLTAEGPNWDDYWKYWTEGEFTDAVCACCGKSLTVSNRVGAHIRLKGEPDNTIDAWIALYCSACNNWQVREQRKVSRGSKIVRVKMSKPHANALPESKAK